MENQQVLHAGAIPRGALVHAGIPNVVAGPFGLPALQRLIAKHIEDWTRLKIARAMAARRHLQQHTAGVVTLTMVGLIAVLIPASSPFLRSVISHGVQDTLAFMAMLSSGLTLLIGLRQLSQNHKARARDLEACARALDELVKRLASAQLSNESQLAPFLARYCQVMERCSADHAETDMRLAEAELENKVLEDSGSQAGVNQPTSRHRRRLAKLRYHFDTYGAHAALALTPLVLGLAVWWLQPVTSLIAKV